MDEYAMSIIQAELNDLKSMGVQPFLFVESGSKLYGFDDDKSDVDIRGVVVEHIDNILSFNNTQDTMNKTVGIVDFEYYELAKFMGLLSKGNFNIIEWIYSPYVFEGCSYGGLNINWLRRVAKDCITVHTGNHVRGWAKSMYKMDWTNPKKCLYAIRPLMVYINYLKNRTFQSNIVKLTEYLAFLDMGSHVFELINLKQNRRDVPESVADKNREWYDKLMEDSMSLEEEMGVKKQIPDETMRKIKQAVIDIRWHGIRNELESGRR